MEEVKFKFSVYTLQGRHRSGMLLLWADMSDFLNSVCICLSIENQKISKLLSDSRQAYPFASAKPCHRQPTISMQAFCHHQCAMVLQSKNYPIFADSPLWESASIGVVD